MASSADCSNVSSPTPCWLSKGGNTEMMVSTILSTMVTMPGLLIVHSSIAKKKWAVNTAFMVLYAFTATLICWVTIGHSLSFGVHLLPFWGTPVPVLHTKFLFSPSKHPATNKTLDFPSATMVAFQFAFAATSAAALSSAVSARMSFVAWATFLPLWIIFSYSVGASSIWGGGFLWRWGVLDFAGGYVVHLSAGVTGAVLAHWIGPRLPTDRSVSPPNNVLLVLAGSGLVWMGWNGFAAGSSFSSSVLPSLAVINTNISAATSVLVWTLLDSVYHGRPSIVGAIQGLIAGLVAISPAAGLTWMTRRCHQKNSTEFCYNVDDTAGAVHSHGVAALTGGLLTGVLADPDLTALFSQSVGSRGVLYGGFEQIFKQLASALLVISWNLIVTSVICMFLKRLMKLRMSDEQLGIGDDAVHGEEAYAIWGDGEKITPCAA